MSWNWKLVFELSNARCLDMLEFGIGNHLQCQQVFITHFINCLQYQDLPLRIHWNHVSLSPHLCLHPAYVSFHTSFSFYPSNTLVSLLSPYGPLPSSSSTTLLTDAPEWKPVVASHVWLGPTIVGGGPSPSTSLAATLHLHPPRPSGGPPPSSSPAALLTKTPVRKKKKAATKWRVPPKKLSGGTTCSPHHACVARSNDGQW